MACTAFHFKIILKVKFLMSTNLSLSVFSFFPVLLSVVGNGLVLLISYCHRSNMVGSEMLYVNLALADLFCCILFYPLSISSSFHHAWLGGRTSCTYYGFGCYVFGLCSILTITAICGLRYLKIRYCSAYGEVANEWKCVANKDILLRYL